MQRPAVGSTDPEPRSSRAREPRAQCPRHQPWLWALVFFPEEIGDGGRRGAPQAALSVRQAALYCRFSKETTTEPYTIANLQEAIRYMTLSRVDLGAVKTAPRAPFRRKT
jgi:hypothetical protein